VSETRKVWVVVAGAYSDQSVDAVFTNETNANLYAAAFDYWATEIELDPALDPHVAAGEQSWDVTWTPAQDWNATTRQYQESRPRAHVSSKWGIADYGVVEPSGYDKKSLHVWIWAKSKEAAEDEAERLFKEHLRTAPR